MLFFILCSTIASLFLLYYVHIPSMPFRSVDEIASSARTGDLILFRSSENAARFFMPWTHVGMIVVDHEADRTYIVEAHEKGDAHPGDVGGVNLHDARWRISAYDGVVSYAALKRPLTEHQRRMVRDLVDRYRKVPFYTPFARHYLMHCLLGLDRGKPDETVHCSEFIGLLYKHIGMYSGETRCLTPTDIARSGHHQRLVRIKRMDR